MKKRKHIVVTGGAGFIGCHIASRLLSDGYKVTILDNLSTGKEENIPQGANFIKTDLGVESSYDLFKDITYDAVFHLAGQPSGEASFKDPIYDFRSHAMSTFWLLQWCRKMKISRFMYASSMSVYGDPNYLPVDEAHIHQPKTFYAAAKISAEAYIRLYQALGVNITIFRLFSVYGPGQNLDNKMQGMVSIYLSYFLEDKPVIVRGSSERFRDFIYIDDVVDVWLKSFENPVTYGKVYNIANGQKTKVKDLLDILKNLFGNKNYPVRYRNGTIGDQFGIVADIKRVTQDLGWRPRVKLQTGLKKMVEPEKKRLSCRI